MRSWNGNLVSERSTQPLGFVSSKTFAPDAAVFSFGMRQTLAIRAPPHPDEESYVFRSGVCNDVITQSL